MKTFLKNYVNTFAGEERESLFYFLRWTCFSLIIGVLGGLIGGSFSQLIQYVTGLRQAHTWLLFCMPLAGVIIVWLYSLFRERGYRGTNVVLDAITTEQPVDKPIAPLIYVSSILSHLVGASAGREGAALQMGGGLGEFVSRLLRMESRDRKIAVMAGMSAVFAGVFGTPIAAAVFPIEVVSIGIMHYSALVPCIFAAFIGHAVSAGIGTGFEAFIITEIPAFNLRSVLLIVLLGLLCGIVAQLFCFCLHFADKLYSKLTPNYYVRILAASVIFIVLTLCVRTDLYLGTSTKLLEDAFAGNVPYFAFFFKMIFTAIALGGKFKGGEIVPTLCIGASFGCVFGMLTGLSPSLCAACGMAALFVGVTNCPVSTLIISLELLSMEAMPFYSIVIAVAFCFSGYASLYQSQRIMYSKTKPLFLNRKAD